MATLAELFTNQENEGSEIQKIITNFKKDSADRKKTAIYFQERLRRLHESWKQFQETDTKIREMCQNPMEHEYFLEDYYKSIEVLAIDYIKIFTNEADRLMSLSGKQLNLDKPGTSKLAVNQQNQNQQNNNDSNENAIAAGLIRKINVRMTALNRLLSGVSDIDNQPLQYYQLKIDTINKLWSQIEVLNDEAHEISKNPVVSGLDQNQYNCVYDLVQIKLVSLSVKADKLRNNIAPNRTEVTVSPTKNAIQLPKVVIPHFSGDYLKWRQFNDLFTEMVDKQPIPAIQKMWYLKTNLSGEAEHLISQFTLSEENYQAAWKTIQERYNNKRILVANLVDKLLNQPAATSSAASIKDLHDTTKECLLALNNLGIVTSSWDAILIQLLFRKIEKNVHLRFMQSLQTPKEVPMVADVLSFLELQFQSMEAIAQKEKPVQKAVSTVITSNKTNSTCKFCSNDTYKIFHCNKFLQLAEADRLNWVQQQKMCVNCFKTDHTAKTCTSGCCKKCEKKHNTLLHLGKQSQRQRRPALQTQESSTSKANPNSSPSNAVAVTSAATNVTTGRQGYVLLATAKVIITAPNGASDEFRAILDSGSQVNLVTERLIKRLAVASTEASLCIDGVGKVQKRSTHRVNISMKSRYLTFATDLEAFILPSIVPAQPTQYIDVSSWGLPKHIHLADPQFNKQEKIDILLGAEFYFSLT